MRFNGVDPCTLHRGISIAREILPGMAPRAVETVRGAGAETLAGVEDERGEYRLILNVAGKSKDEAYEIRALIAKWARSSGETCARIEPTHWHGMAYDGIVEKISDPEFVFGFGTIEVLFLLPDARAYEVAASSAYGSTGSMRMMISGSDATAPVITQTIKDETEQLVWQLDGTVFFVVSQGTLLPGQIVEADFGTGSMTVDGVHAEHLIDYTQSRWKPGFDPGIHRITSSDSGTMSARWHNRWA